MPQKLSLDELNRLDVSAYKSAEKFPFVFVLDDIRSMNNIGSAFRTADAFRCAHVYLVGITAQPPHREISKTALGADESVDWTYFESAEACHGALKALGYTVYCIEQVDQSISLHDFKPVAGNKYAFVFGNEVFGVNDYWIEAASGSLEIPQFGTKHSLNVSVTMGVVAWDFVSKSQL
ncbi:MAG: rRNA ((2251)-2-O)-methyltransferase [Bacteroidota bacterium]|jgi:tRNA G18 (ribose-2'-O)-methylase SpoU